MSSAIITAGAVSVVSGYNGAAPPPSPPIPNPAATAVFFGHGDDIVQDGLYCGSCVDRINGQTYQSTSPGFAPLYDTSVWGRPTPYFQQSNFYSWAITGYGGLGDLTSGPYSFVCRWQPNYSFTTLHGLVTVSDHTTNAGLKMMSNSSFGRLYCMRNTTSVFLNTGSQTSGVTYTYGITSEGPNLPCKLYKNGVSLGTLTTPNVAITTPTAIYWGVYNDLTSSHCTGYIPAVAGYSGVLTDAEMLDWHTWAAGEWP